MPRLPWQRIVPVTLFVVFSLNFGFYKVAGDATLYFAFVQRLFGDAPMAVPDAYGFGIGLLSAPFYAAAKLVAWTGLAGSHGAALPVAAMTIASTVFVAAAWVMSSHVLRRLALPFPEMSVALAILGSPVWYYASFEPMHAHPPDAAIFAAVSWAVLTLWDSPTPGRALAAGAAIGIGMTVRPFNLALLVGLGGVLVLYGRWRDALIVAAGTAVTVGGLLLIPVALHVRFGGVSVVNELGIYPLSPIRMLFTDHRGLFIWTPVTALAVIGIVAGIARNDLDGYLRALGAMALTLLVFYVGFKVWDGGWSYSARFLASPVTLYAIGLSLLIKFARPPFRQAVIVLAMCATGWALFLGMNHAFGFADQPDGASDIVRPYVSGNRTAGAFAARAWSYSRARHVVERVIR